MKILITEPVHQSGIKYLENLGYTLKYSKSLDKKQIIEDLKGVDAAIIRIVNFDREIIENSNLKVIGVHGTGTDIVDLDAAKDNLVAVVNAPGANARSVAELNMALILDLARQLTKSANNYAKGNFEIKYQLNYMELKGKTLGILGYGNIGKALAEIAHFGFGMKILTYNHRRKEADTYVNLTTDRDYVIKNCDFLALCLASTPQTDNSIGSEELKSMKDSAFLINTSRGTLIKEDDLLKALEEKIIAGAAIDTTIQEPLDKNHPFFKLDNLILTPHIGGTTEEALEKTIMLTAKGVDDVLSGRETAYRVI
ncbi:D-3-phosphoglycerate dehydrogenase [Peptoniphilus sp. ING2-D1G]|nr:D-3-phosphoglycerate dehydrogenase [Peptoniphilus sp. ING2-D1G]